MITNKQLDAAEAAFRAAYLDPGLMRHALKKALEAADSDWKATVRDLFDECHRDRIAITEASVIAFIEKRHRSYFCGDAS